MARLLLFVLLILSCSPAIGAPADPQAGDAGPLFDSLRLALLTKPPAICNAWIYGSVAAKSPDGALCLCHAGFNGKPGFWEQIGTGRPCWADKK